MEPASKTLEQAWRRFADRIGALDALVLQPGAPGSPHDRAEGYRYLVRTLAANLDLWIRRGDPDDPRVIWVNDSWGLPNADGFYTNVPLRGDAVYEITGRRGSVHWLNFQVTAGWFGSGTPMRVVSEISDDQIAIGADGRFTLILGGPKRERNWLPLADDASALTIRQFFYDWDGETRAEVEIRRLGARREPEVPDPAALAKRLDEVAAILEATAEFGPKRSIAGRAHMTNAFSPPIGAGNQLGIDRNLYSGGHYVLGPDEALIVEVRPPERCRYWGIQLGTFWMEPVDFANHQSSLNGRQAAIDPDGVFRAVISARDPGVANWLDTADHSEGGMLIRWLECEAGPRPATKKVAFDEVHEALPASTVRVSPAQRAEILERRRAHVARRYR
jgi:hypothetical protein